MMENLRLRRARDEDLVEMAYIHYSSFPEMGGSPEERRERLVNNPLVPLENYWVATLNHQVIGMFAQYHFHIGRGEQPLPVVGIASVGVAPNFRRRGVASFMMTQALEIMEHNGVPLSILYPFRLSFYRKLGWGIVTRAILYKLNPQQIGNGMVNGEIELVRREDQKEEVQLLYDHMTHQGLSLIIRDPVHWEELVFPRGLTYLYRSPQGKVEGYIIISYLPLNGEERWVGSHIRVWEWIALTPQALRALINFLARLSDQVVSIIFPDQSGIPLEFLIADPLSPGVRQAYLSGARVGEQSALMMGRIVNVKRAILQGSPYGDGEIRLTLQLTDPCLSVNRQPVTFHFRNRGVEIIKGPGECTLKTSIETFSSIWWGALRVNHAWMMSLVEIDPVEAVALLDSIFSRTPPICWDYF